MRIRFLIYLIKMRSQQITCSSFLTTKKSKHAYLVLIKMEISFWRKQFRENTFGLTKASLHGRKSHSFETEVHLNFHRSQGKWAKYSPLCVLRDPAYKSAGPLVSVFLNLASKLEEWLAHQLQSFRTNSRGRNTWRHRGT